MVSSASGDRPNAFRSANNAIRGAANATLAIVLAPDCAACGSVLEEPLRGPVCPACWRAVVTTPLSWQSPLHSSLDSVMSAAPYDGVLREIIHAWKFEGRQSLARPLAELVRRQCAPVLEGAGVVAAVPMTPWRKWRRGFNQTEDLARRLGMPHRRLLARWRPRPAQSSLPSALRRRNLEASIVVPPWQRSAIAGRVIVLVDDVITTGATLDACASAPKQAGAKEVRAVTLALTVLRSARAA
jgi:ComF family protein